MKSKSKNTIKIGVSFIIGFLVHWFLTPTLETNKESFLESQKRYDNQLFVNEMLPPSYSLSPTTEREVYICEGPKSKRYHFTKKCGGLTRCSTEKYKVTISRAIELGRTLCGFED